MGVGGVCHLPKSFFFLKMEGASGFQIPSEDSPQLCLSQKAAKDAILFTMAKVAKALCIGQRH